MNILLFPGQGAQKVGMARDLADRFDEARQCLESIDDALGFSLTRIMWEGPEDELLLTHNAQPAILAHSAAVLAVVKASLGSVAGAAGHSLGEYSAYLAAGALEATEAAKLVRRRGELMNQAGADRPGSMAAVLGLDGARVAECCREASTEAAVVVAANLNAPDQTVVSGDPVAVGRAGEFCKAAGAKRVLALKVSGAFHSPLMAGAGPGLARALDQAAMRDPAFPVIANASAAAVRTAAAARQLLTDQLTAPVRWVECVRALDREANGQPARFLEIGPGSVLSGLVKRILPGAQCISLGTTADLERFLG